MIEQELIGKLIYDPELIKTCSLKTKWVSDKNLRDILDVLVDNFGQPINANQLYEKVKQDVPSTELTAEVIEDIRLDGMMAGDMDQLTRGIEERYYRGQVTATSAAYADYPSNANLELMQDAMRELEGLDQEGEDGGLEELHERLAFEMENDVAGGIKTYKILDQALSGGLYPGELNVIGARPGVGKGHPNWLEIPTPKGNVRVGDLEVGDYVFDRKGQPNKVTGVYPRGMLDTYEVTLSDGRKTIVDGDHIWSYYTSRGNLANKTTRGMYSSGVKNKDNRCKYRIPTNEPVHFERVEHEIPPYTIGALLGDGSLLESRLTISSNDEPVVRKVAAELKVDYTFGVHQNYNWHFKDVDGDFLMTKPVLGRVEEILAYSHDKAIPKEYLYDSLENRMRLLNGLFDTDGSAVNGNNRLTVSYSTTSKKLKEQVDWLLKSCGYLTSIAVDRREGRRDCYDIRALAQPDRLEELFTLQRKLDIVKSFGRKKRRNYKQIGIDSIVRTGKQEEITCISVESPDQLYLANDFIVTHNTAYGINLAIQALTRNDDVAVDFFTLEMPRITMYKRFVTRVSEINGMRLRNPYKTIQAHEREAIMQKSKEFLSKDLKIFSDKNSLDELVIQIRRRHHEIKGKQYMPIIDYLQLIEVGGYSENKNIEVGRITRTLKLLANELEIPIIVLSQLNREMKPDERPQLSNLRDSGNIEQDASQVMFLFNEADESVGEYGQGKSEATNRVICYVAKNRNGITGDVFYRFLKSKMFFQELNE